MVGAGVYPGIYVLEYAYMLIILSMSYGLLNASSTCTRRSTS
jgi:hypothetical protein